MRSIVASAAIFAATLASGEIAINHAQGETTFDRIPEKIVTFDIASLDSLAALGVDVVGLPKDFVPAHLAQFEGDQYSNVGSLFEPNFEVVASLQPDAIIVANRSSRAYNDLAELAPTVDFTVWGTPYLQQFKSMSRELGKLVDKESEVEAKLAAIDNKVAATQALASEAGNALIVLTSGGKLSAYGPGSRFGWIHDDLGVQPVIADVEAATHGDPISFEFILQHNPDYLFVLDRDGAINPDNAGAKAALDNDLIKATKAHQNGNIVYLNSVNWYIVMSGLGAVDQMVTEVHDALQ